MVFHVLLLILFGYYFIKKSRKKTTVFKCDKKNTKKNRSISQSYFRKNKLGKINYNENFIAINKKLKINHIISDG